MTLRRKFRDKKCLKFSRAEVSLQRMTFIAVKILATEMYISVLQKKKYSTTFKLIRISRPGVISTIISCERCQKNRLRDHSTKVAVIVNPHSKHIRCRPAICSQHTRLDKIVHSGRMLELKILAATPKICPKFARLDPGEFTNDIAPMYFESMDKDRIKAAGNC